MDISNQTQNFQLPSIEQLIEIINGILSGDNNKIATNTKYLK